MFQRSCEGCGAVFTASKRNRKWCSDVCGRRTRRQNARAFSPVITPVIPPAAVSDPYVRLNVDLAGALGASLPDGLLAALASDDDYRGDCTEEEFATVTLHVTDRFQAAIRRADSDGSDRLGRSLQALIDDLVDTRVVSYLAGALRE